MKRILILVATIFTLSFVGQAQQKTLHDFTVETIGGEPFSLNLLKGKKVMIVNTASKCGLTPQYELLEKLYKQYKGKNFIIIGFPANNFMNQEPGSYGVTFPMMSKISVKGSDIHPLYKWLTSKEENGVEDAKVTWNFQKFLIDEEGRLVRSIPPREKPDTEDVISWITQK
jgi:glutathione peroxidase